MKQPPIDLLERCKKDDRRAHYDLYRWCFSSLTGVCKRYYKNEEDIKSSLNMAFVKVIQNMSGYLSKYDNVPFELWMRRITINYIIDEFRKNKRYHESIELSDGYESEDEHPMVNPIEGKELMESISNAVNQLPDMNKAVFNLYMIDGYKHEEIADLLNISANTSKVHLHRAKEKLKDLLGPERANKQLTY